MMKDAKAPRPATESRGIMVADGGVNEVTGLFLLLSAPSASTIHPPPRSWSVNAPTFTHVCV